MDQFGQSNNNDLQRAIDEISGGNDGVNPPAEPVEDNNIQVNLGEPPVPPMNNDFGMPPAEPRAEVNPPEPPAEMPAPAPEAAPMGGDLAGVRESALRELVPIIDKAGLSADRQFGIIAAVVESSHDKSFIPKALDAARMIPDEKTRAEALLKLVGLIDH